MGFNVWSVLLVLLVVVLVFGTKKFRNIGEDLGEGIKGFKKGLQDEEEAKTIEEKADEVVQNATNAAEEATQNKDA